MGTLLLSSEATNCAKKKTRQIVEANRLSIVFLLHNCKKMLERS